MTQLIFDLKNIDFIVKKLLDQHWDKSHLLIVAKCVFCELKVFAEWQDGKH